MARIRFLDNFDYKPNSQITIAYLAGMELTVKRECADRAIAAGKAESLAKLNKGADNGER